MVLTLETLNGFFHMFIIDVHEWFVSEKNSLNKYGDWIISVPLKIIWVYELSMTRNPFLIAMPFYAAPQVSEYLTYDEWIHEIFMDETNWSRAFHKAIWKSMDLQWNFLTHTRHVFLHETFEFSLYNVTWLRLQRWGLIANHVSHLLYFYIGVRYL